MTAPKSPEVVFDYLPRDYSNKLPAGSDQSFARIARECAEYYSRALSIPSK